MLSELTETTPPVARWVAGRHCEKHGARMGLKTRFACNLSGRVETEENFFIFSARNPLKSPDSKK